MHGHWHIRNQEKADFAACWKLQILSLALHLQEAYVRGVSAWNFDVAALKSSAAHESASDLATVPEGICSFTKRSIYQSLQGGIAEWPVPNINRNIFPKGMELQSTLDKQEAL